MTRFLFVLFGIVLLFPSISIAGTDPNCEYPNVLLLVDKSGSMDDSISGGRKWDIQRNAIQSIINNFSSNIRFGLALFPWTDGCQTGQVLVQIGDNTGSQILSTLSNNGPGGSTPLASSLKAMNNYSGIHDPSRRNFVLLMTDGMDTCSSDPTGEPVQAVKQLYNSGVGVFVVGFGSGVDANTLNNMAINGGYPRNGNPKYYQCDNAQELNQALNDILKIISQEICDGKDNDCNGEIDDKIPPQVCSGMCNKQGFKYCGNGQWGPCRDAQGNEIPEVGDEGKPCDTKNLGVCKDGIWKCDVNGNLLCDQLVQPSAETCDNKDNDCDGFTDEDEAGNVLKRPCENICGYGDEYCVNGEYDPKTCDGPKPNNACGECGPTPVELCDGKDNDCNGLIDDLAPCESNKICINGTCMSYCEANECPKGYTCKQLNQGMICVPDTMLDCAGVNCPDGFACKNGTCQPLPCEEGNSKCENGTRVICKNGVWTESPCKSGFECKNGVCVEISCYTKGCPSGYMCKDGSCNTTDPCAGISCKTDEFCRDGICVKACGFVNCGEGYYCDSFGNCVLDKCYGIKCKVNQYCKDGKCLVDKCYMGGCPYNRSCDQSTGECVDDPCVYIDCPEGLKCYQGQCVKPEDIPVVIYDPNVGVDAGTDASNTDTANKPDNSNQEFDYGNYEPDDDTSVPLDSGFNPSAFDRESSGSCSCSTLF